MSLSKTALALSLAAFAAAASAQDRRPDYGPAVSTATAKKIAAATIAIGLVIIRPFTDAPVGFDTQASVAYFDRLVAGQRLEQALTTTPKPLITLTHGLLHIGGDWRPIVWATLLVHAVAAGLVGLLAARAAGLVAGAAAGLAIGPWRVVRELSDGSALTVSELARRLRADGNLLTKHIGTLRKANAIEHKREPLGDQRQRHYRVPPFTRRNAKPGEKVVDYGCCVLRFV